MRIVSLFEEGRTVRTYRTAGTVVGSGLVGDIIWSRISEMAGLKASEKVEWVRSRT